MTHSLCRPGSIQSNPIEAPTTNWRKGREAEGGWDDRPYVYVRTPDGVVTKVYRSYPDYCED